MKRLRGLLFLLWLLPAALTAGVAVPAAPDRVVDEAGLFSRGDRERIVNAILELEKTTGGQMVVWTVPSLEGEPIETVSMRAAEKWKIGHQGKDDGVLLTIAQKDRAIRLEVGYGWEGKINDARAGDIIRAMGGYFRNQDYAGGVLLAVGKVSQFAAGGEVAPPVRWWKTAWGWVSLLLFLFVFWAICYGYYRAAKWLFNCDINAPSGGSSDRTSGSSSSSSSNNSFGSFGGGFHGGGGSFGGGGASGKW